MGDFFYYGQKDTIRRLNELAGRGAVVASYAPAVGRSPLGGPNGYMNPAWIDPSIPIVTQQALCFGGGSANKYGYNYLQGGQALRMYKLATLEPSVSSTYSALRIDAMVGGWGAADLTAMTIVIGSRVVAPVAVDWSSSRYIPVNIKFVAYQESTGHISVYLVFTASAFAQASFQMMAMGATTYATPSAVTVATGTLVWDSSVGPESTAYISPRSRGVGTTIVGTSFDGLVEVRAQDGSTAASSYLAGAPKADATAAGADTEVLRHGVAGNSGVNFSGFMQWLVSAGTGGTFKTGYKLSLKARDIGSGTSTNTLFSVSGTGLVFAQWLKAGSASTRAVHTMNATAVQFGEILEVGREGAPSSCMAIRGSDGQGGWNNAQSVMYVGKNSTTSRSINVPGTVNTMGNDYAEYIFKCLMCGIIAPGQIVGITADNKVTDKWADAVMFSIKSTAPSFVGGDSWANDVGQRPSPQAGPAPTHPLRREDVITQQPVPGSNPPEYEDVVTAPGDTDDEWAEKLATYTAALAAHNIAAQQDAEAMATFDAALEVERQKVDRIAIAGRVPVNVQGAQPGDYIVPVQDGAGIKGIAVHEDDINMKLYLRAVGRVISIEPDGRAYVMVKVV